MLDDQFISEPITPVPGSFSPEGMSHGLASLPGSFVWRDRVYRILECLEHSKVSAHEGHTADGEVYLRREQFRVRLDSGQTATIYVLRQAPAGARRESAKKRWFLYTMTPASPSSDGPGGRHET